MMRVFNPNSAVIPMLALMAATVPAALSAEAADPNIVVQAPGVAGPEIKGVITARNGEKIKVAAADGTATVIAFGEATVLKGGSSLFGSKREKLTTDALINGLPVTVKTWQTDAGLVAAVISFKPNDLKIARMIQGGTNQRFEEQTAATDEVRRTAEALRSRMGDIDKYNIKSSTNVFFDSGKTALSEKAKADLCVAASEAERMDNALLLVVGYTDSTGSAEVNQVLSEKRAGAVINYLQQICHWKPYRMLTPTGMATADPLADNSTPEGKAQNRRVAVNVLVSKSLDGM